MAGYDYSCGACGHTFELNVPIADRDKMLSKPCPECGDFKIVRDFASPIINLGWRQSTIQKGAPTPFREHLQRIKNGLGKSGRCNGIE